LDSRAHHRLIHVTCFSQKSYPLLFLLPRYSTLLAVCFPLTFAAGILEAQGSTPSATSTGTLTLTGTVKAEATGMPIPYSTVTVDSVGRERFTDERGSFTYFAFPVGRHRIRIRQLGYLPLDTNVVLAGLNMDLSFSLIRVPSTLADVQVNAPIRRCIVPEENGFVDDPDLTTVLGEARKNAERERLLRRTYPFEYKLAQSHDTYDATTNTHRIVHDTTTFRSDDDWKYHKGKVVSGDRNKVFGDVRVMRLPTLTDLADQRFLMAHCFKYAGVYTEDSVPVHRIDFEPLPEIVAPDVEGSIFIDSATYIIRRAEFRLTKGGSIKPAILAMTVTTTYREILPSVALFNEIRSTQPLGPPRPGDHQTEFRETQTLLSFRFLYGGPPGSDRAGVWRKIVAADPSTQASATPPSAPGPPPRRMGPEH
jgi:Carboxypeptidase regulatory-like domain